MGEMFTSYRAGARNLSSDLEMIAQHQAKLHSSMVIPSGVRKDQAAVVSAMRETANATALADARLRAYNTEMMNLSNRMVNWGKNTQWAGRQLTVGLTVPLAAAGTGLAIMFDQLDKSMRKLLAVYGVGGAAGGAFSNIVPSKQELDNIKRGVMDVAAQMADLYGQSAQATVGVAADLAAAGYTQQQLLDLTKTATTAMILGEADQQSAIKATIALQNTYRLSTTQTADALAFFSAAQAATSTTMKDLIDAVPRVGPIMQNLGGTYKDTVAMIVAMKEGGVAAGEGANSLKNSLQRLVAPTNTAVKQLAAMGINLKAIGASGDPVTIIEKVQQALSKLSPLQRQIAITDIFGKLQAARATALLDNFNRSGTQSAKVMQMMSLNSKELADIQKHQIDILSESTSMQFSQTLEKLKIQLVPIGEMFLQIGTGILKVVSFLTTAFQNLGPIKWLIAGGTALVAIFGPMVMLLGLLANLAGQMFKLTNQFKMFREGFKGAGGLASPFKAVAAGIAQTQKVLVQFDAAEYASLSTTTELTGALDAQGTAWAQITRIVENATIALRAASEASIAAATGATQAASAMAKPLLPGGVAPSSNKSIATELIAAEAQRAPFLPSVGQNVRMGRTPSKRYNYLDEQGNSAGTNFIHLNPDEVTRLTGSNVRNDPNYDPRRNALGNLSVQPGYMGAGNDAWGKRLNSVLGQRDMPIIPPALMTAAVQEEIAKSMGFAYATPKLQREVGGHFSLENIAATEGTKLATLRATAQMSPTQIKELESMARTGTSSEQISGHFKSIVGPKWAEMVKLAQQEVLALYQKAEMEMKAAWAESGNKPVGNFAQLSQISARFGEMLREEYISIANTMSEEARASITASNAALTAEAEGTVNESMKRGVAGIVNAMVGATDIALIIEKGFVEFLTLANE
jgi:TP901 family phage tail tape measure protein